MFNNATDLFVCMLAYQYLMLEWLNTLLIFRFMLQKGHTQEIIECYSLSLLETKIFQSRYYYVSVIFSEEHCIIIQVFSSRYNCHDMRQISLPSHHYFSSNTSPLNLCYIIIHVCKMADISDNIFRQYFPPSSRRHFEMDFLEWKYMNFD